MTMDQIARWLWCFCHLAIAAYVQVCAHKSLSMTALSHLLFFDALGAFLCMAVDVFCNFEVWRQSSISSPFGLERSEVLAGLAMSIILLFMGLDIVSHGLKHALEHSTSRAAHHHHHTSYHHYSTFAALAGALSTGISASVLGNHARIGQTIRFPLLESLPLAIRNPSHFLPITLSLSLVVLPLFGTDMSESADSILGFVYALGMIALGTRLCYGVGRILLMSWPGPSVQELIQQLSMEPGITFVDEAKVWQVHYGLCVASFKLRIAHPDQAEHVRERVTSLVETRLARSSTHGSKDVTWETSVQITIGS